MSGLDYIARHQAFGQPVTSDLGHSQTAQVAKLFLLSNEFQSWRQQSSRPATTFHRKPFYRAPLSRSLGFLILVLSLCLCFVCTSRVVWPVLVAVSGYHRWLSTMEAMDGAMLQELEFLGTIIFYLIVTLLSLSYVTVVLRLWVRCRITKSAGWDDAAMVATLVSVYVALRWISADQSSFFFLITVLLYS
jgi:hypothetical protein